MIGNFKPQYHSGTCPTGCSETHTITTITYTYACSTEDYRIRRRRRPPGWGEVNLCRGSNFSPKPVPTPLRGARLESKLIRWMSKALIGGQK